MIDLRNVEKTYYSNAGDIHALKKTNLHINAGEIFIRYHRPQRCR